MIFSVYDSVFGRALIVAIGEPDDEKVARYIERSGYKVGNEFREKMKMLPSNNGRFTWESDTALTLIRLRRLDPRNPSDVAVLAHEASHMAVSLFSLMKQPVGPDTDEPLAYYVGFVVREVMRKVV